MCIDGWRYHSWNSLLSASRGYPLLHPLRPRDLRPPRLRRRDGRMMMPFMARIEVSIGGVDV